MAEPQNSSGVVVVAGARPFSLGDAIVERVCAEAAHSQVLVLDVESAPNRHPAAISKMLNLNPLQSPSGFKAWCGELDVTLRSMLSVTARLPIRALVLSIAKYDVARLEDTSTEDRTDMLGINLLAKCELLHTIMRINADNGFENAEFLNVFDFGSMHSVKRTPRRALYNMTKAATRNLCELLSGGREVRRALHIAPGCIDTTMLHWNHWTLKEHGDPQVPELVRLELPSLYEAIFRDGSDEAFQTALRKLGLTGAELPFVFDRYRRRRKEVAATEEGIIAPEDLAAYISSLILEKLTIGSGILKVSAPAGCMRVCFEPF